jgi:hypothetical protein
MQMAKWQLGRRIFFRVGLLEAFRAVRPGKGGGRTEIFFLRTERGRQVGRAPMADRRWQMARWQRDDKTIDHETIRPVSRRFPSSLASR